MLDAIVCAAGHEHFDPLAKMNFEKFQVGLQDKLMGQVNFVLAGQAHLNDGGSFTLTSGSTKEIPIRHGTSQSMVDGAVEGFVRAAAIELPRGLRINAVSPTILQESMEAYGHYFVGYEFLQTGILSEIATLCQRNGGVSLPQKLARLTTSPLSGVKGSGFSRRIWAAPLRSRGDCRSLLVS